MAASLLSSNLARIVNRSLNLRRAVRFVWNASPRLAITNVLLLLTQGLLPLLSLYLMKLLLDEVSAALTSADRQAAFNNVLTLILLAGLVYIATNAIATAGKVLTQAQGRIVADYMQKLIHAKSIELDLEYYESAKYHDTLHRAQQEALYRPLMIVNGLTNVLRASVSLVGVLSLLLTIHWAIVGVVLLAVLPGVVVRLIHSRRLYALQKEYTSHERLSSYYHWMLTWADNAKEIRLNQLGPTFMSRFQTVRQELQRVRLNIDVRASLAEQVAQLIAALAVYGSYGFIAYRTVMGSNTLGDLVLYYQVFQRGQSSLQELLGGMASLYENTLFLSDFYEFLDLHSRLETPAHPQPVPRPLQTGVVFDGISFKYPHSAQEVLTGVRLELRPGEVIALVGENGSGKTTLVKLLCRLYDPTVGKITVDGMDLCELDPTLWRQEISVIFQDYARYMQTVRENIGFGDVNAAPDDERIIAAAKRADADGFIRTLSHGYDTLLGKLFDNGEELSVGQWQKIALARAFLRQSQIIVLDEPTSALDPKSEYEVFRKFRDLLEGRSAVLISHRLSTVRMADRIYVMQNGTIVETGTHDELVRRAGSYAEMFEMQAQYYR